MISDLSIFTPIPFRSSLATTAPLGCTTVKLSQKCGLLIPCLQNYTRRWLFYASSTGVLRLYVTRKRTTRVPNSIKVSIIRQINSLPRYRQLKRWRKTRWGKKENWPFFLIETGRICSFRGLEQTGRLSYGSVSMKYLPGSTRLMNKHSRLPLLYSTIYWTKTMLTDAPKSFLKFDRGRSSADGGSVSTHVIGVRKKKKKEIVQYGIYRT